MGLQSTHQLGYCKRNQGSARANVGKCRVMCSGMPALTPFVLFHKSPNKKTIMPVFVRLNVTLPPLTFRGTSEAGRNLTMITHVVLAIL